MLSRQLMCKLVLAAVKKVGADSVINAGSSRNNSSIKLEIVVVVFILV